MKKLVITAAILYSGILSAQIKPDTTTRPAPIAGSKVNPIPAAYNSGIKLNYVRVWEASRSFSNESQLTDSTRTVREVKQTTQYFDGLGRLLQTVAKGISPSGKDLVSPILYDEFGREVFKYLPYVQQTGNPNNGNFKTDPFNEQASFYSNPTLNPGVTGEQIFYSKTVFENSPLGRSDTMFAPGNNWGGRHVGVSIKNQINTLADSVRIWRIAMTIGSIPTTSATYPAGALYKMITVDEHGKQVVEYKDKEGQVVLKKIQLDITPSAHHAGWLCTYYVYDDFNQLRFVISPKAVEASVGGWIISNTVSNELCFRYEYDSRKRMILKKVPGAGEVRMVYDARDRLVMTQDGNMQGTKWLVTQYDELNRPVRTFIWNNTGNRTAHEAAAAASTSYPVLSGNYELMTEQYYDDYNWTSGVTGISNTLNTEYVSGTDYISTYNTAPQYAQPVDATSAVRGAVTGTKKRIIGTDNFLYTISLFDDRGRIIQTQSTNTGGGTDITTIQYDFSGQPIQNHLIHNMPANGQPITVWTAQEYDHAGRLISIKKKINDGVEKTISNLSYDEIGQMKTKKLGTYALTNDWLEILNYTYNIRGWLSGINRGYANANYAAEATAQSDRWFGMQLNYDYGYREDSTLRPQLNGNISGTIWRSKGDGAKRSYGFSYDATNRLMRADFTQYSGTSNPWNTNYGIDFSMKMGDGINPSTAYDANGNIRKMKHRGIKGINSEIIDSLQYSYYENSNKLKSVADYNNDADSKLGDFKTSRSHPQFTSKNDVSAYVSTAGNLQDLLDYSYDDNGNLINDNNKGIESIRYNYLNLPDSISFINEHAEYSGHILYKYDAAGDKIQKIIYEQGDNTATFLYKETVTSYVSGFVYDSVFTYYRNDDQVANPNKLVFFAHEEGRVRENRIDSLSLREYYFDYFIKDHLGNVRMVLTEEEKIDFYPPASEEPANADIEDALYNRVSDTRVALPGEYPTDTYTTPNQYVSKVQGNSNVIGPNKMLKVMAGDKVNIRVSSWYKLNNNSTGNHSYGYIDDLLLALANHAAPLTNGKATWEQILDNGLHPYEEFLEAREESAPPYAKAYLNWVMFDEQFQNIIASSGFDPVGDDGQFKEHVINEIEIPKNGYLFVFVSNEEIDVPVYFDNLQVTHIRSPLLEETHYYPFGLSMAGISSRAASAVVEHGKGFNGNEIQSKEFSNESGMDAYDFNARMYNAQIGRFFQLDPLAFVTMSFSPYCFANNNPINLSDPLGLTADSTIPVVVEYVKPRPKVSYAPGIVAVSTVALAEYASTTTVTGLSLGGALTGAGIIAAPAALLGVSIYELVKSGNPKPLVQPSNTELIAILQQYLAQNAASNPGAAAIAQPPMVQLSKTIDDIFGKHIQYALRATKNGRYPVYSWGTSEITGYMDLKVGDVWKFGTTLNPDGRYTDKFLQTTGLVLVPEFVGKIGEVLFVERLKILNYIVSNGDLPPGNKGIK